MQLNSTSADNSIISTRLFVYIDINYYFNCTNHVYTCLNFIFYIKFISVYHLYLCNEARIEERGSWRKVCLFIKNFAIKICSSKRLSKRALNNIREVPGASAKRSFFKERQHV